MRTLYILLIAAFLFTTANAQELDYKPKILIVTAHPDDDAIFSGTVFKTTQLLGGEVDLALLTNGEGGYKYSTLGRYFYNLELDKEEVGRKYLPAIRKKELIAGGDVVGIRNYFFFDQEDFYFTLDINETLDKWDTEQATKKMVQIIERGDYDFVFMMMPHEQTHGHHKACAIIAMEAIQTLPKEEQPIGFVATIRGVNGEGITYTQLDGFPLSKIREGLPPFEFNRNQKFGLNDRLDYNIISNLVIAEHKSQGVMQTRFGSNRVEQYYYLDFNGDEYLAKAKAYFEAVVNVQPD